MRKTMQSHDDGLEARPRSDVLKQDLLERRQQLLSAVKDRIRIGRTSGAQEGTDDLEHSERDVQNDMTLSLLQIQSEALLSIDAALARLDAGAYGLCIECEREIATRRLRALPFAVRCQVCEEEREDSRNDALRSHQGRASISRPLARPDGRATAVLTRS
jgi:DnaK suppressor protein